MLHGPEEGASKFLRDSELCHDDARSWTSKRSRVPRGNNNNAISGAYVVPPTFQSYNDDEEGEVGKEYQISLVEQVAFVRSQQDLDRLLRSSKSG